jgi:hypothetical protein
MTSRRADQRITRENLNQAAKRARKSITDDERGEIVASDAFRSLNEILPEAVPIVVVIAASLQTGLLIGQAMVVDDHCPECGEFESDCTCREETKR